jgi:hypothetical protein
MSSFVDDPVVPNVLRIGSKFKGFVLVCVICDVRI